METKDIQLTNTKARWLPGEENGKPVEAVDPVKQRVSYCLYARKSSEDDERQALSIDSQIKEVATQAQIEGLHVTEIRTESHSAKDSGKRPVFNKLVEDIRRGLFTGLLAWDPSRISRCGGDLGTIVDLMDSGHLVEIRTHGQVFRNTPNDKFLLMILCSQAKLENDNRGVNVRRGMKTKCEMGFRPNMTPLGYLNDHYSGKGQKKVFVDKKRAPIIKEAFEKVAYEDYTGRDIFNWLKEIGYGGKSGKPITLSSVYRMLNNTYYCGLFEFPTGSGKWYKGSYPPIISRELFDAVQKQLEVAPKSRPGTKVFDYTKMLKCGRCGSGITAQEKFKNRKDGTVKRYVYYHCTQARDFDCPEPYIREEKLTEAFVSFLGGIPIEEIEKRVALKTELDRFRRLSSAVLGCKEGEAQTEISLHNFAKYVLTEGTREEKRELITCLDTTIYLKDREAYIQS